MLDVIEIKFPQWRQKFYLKHWRVIIFHLYIKARIYFILYPITYQNIASFTSNFFHWAWFLIVLLELCNDSFHFFWLRTKKKEYILVWETSGWGIVQSRNCPRGIVLGELSIGEMSSRRVVRSENRPRIEIIIACSR